MTKTESLLLNYMYDIIGIDEAISTKALYPKASKVLSVPPTYLSRCIRSLLKQGYTECVAKQGHYRFYRVTMEGVRHRNDLCDSRGSDVAQKRGACESCNRDKQLLILFRKQYICKRCLSDYDDRLDISDFVYKQEGWLY